MAIEANNQSNLNWVLEQLEQVAQLSQDKTGTTRPAFTPVDHLARQHIITLMHNCGLTVHIDPVGNIIGRFAPQGIDADYPSVVTGSHLDTVPSGSKYDGVLGILCGLAAINSLKERRIKYPIEVIVFAAKEPSRFNLATIGSKMMAGLLTNAALNSIKDENGVRILEELANLNLPVNNISDAVRGANSIKGFVELHIEQGQILEHGRTSLGIVDKVSAPTRLKIVVAGTAGHSGVSPIEDRQDALVSAAAIILAIRNIAAEYEYQGAVATVTNLKTHPGKMNVIPSQVEMLVDILGTEHESIVEILQEIKDAISSITDDYNTPAVIEVLASEKTVTLDSAINQIMEDACCRLGIKSVHMDSRIGYDAMNIAHIAPAALLCIPCKNGSSHNFCECVANDDIAAALTVITDTLYQLAK